MGSGGIIRLVLAGALGAAAFVLLPQEGVLAATQELIAFLALLMAGLLPAMMLTATILRGDGISAVRVEQYGRAMEAQMRFWGVLFLLAGMSTAGIVGAKIFFADGGAFHYAFWRLSLDSAVLGRLSLGLGGFGFGAVLQRLVPSYIGLRSLLSLNIRMAKAQALANDRSLRDALERDAQAATSPDAYAGFKDNAGS